MSEDRPICCDRMRDAVDGWRKDCRHHAHAHECPDALVSVFPGGEHGIIVHDGGASHVTIDHCPWCRADLRVPVFVVDDDDELMVMSSGPMPDFLRNPNPGHAVEQDARRNELRRIREIIPELAEILEHSDLECLSTDTISTIAHELEAIR